MDNIGDILKNKLSFSPENKKEFYQCPDCMDTGYVLRGETAYRCQCMNSKDFLNKQLKAGITPHMRKMNFENFSFAYYSEEKRGSNHLTYRENARAIHGAAKNFVENVLEDTATTGILLQGNVGCGKTFLAAAIANALVNHDVDVKFVVVPDFLDDLRSSFEHDSEKSEMELMTRIKTVPILIFDDLGAHNYTEWSVKTLFSIINYRVNYELPTVVTTNLSIKEIEDLIGSRFYSRLVESCRFFQLRGDCDIRIEKRKSERQIVKKG